MLAHMMQKAEVLVAVLAAIQLDVRVDELVLGQRMGVGEWLVAHLAHVRLDATMNTGIEDKEINYRALEQV